jgi:long-chain acyl-CoA synthetase
VHTCADPLRHAARTAGDRLAIADGGTRRTWSEVWTRCSRLAGALRAAGLRAGDRIAVLSSNSAEYVELFLALPAAGFAIVPLNTRHAVPELRYALQDSGARWLFADRDVGALASAIERVISLPAQYGALLQGAGELPLGDGVDEGDLAGLFYTGGTTGAAKGVMLTHRNLIADSFHLSTALRLAPEDRWLVMGPMFHAAGSFGLLPITWLGASHVILPAFDPADALERIEREGVTVTFGVPTMIAALADEQLARPRDASSLRLLGYGGAPSATEVLRRARTAFSGTELCTMFGATELGPLGSALGHHERMLDDRRARSCGKPAVGVELRVIGEDGRECAPGEIGEVVARGPNVMKGYWNKPEETARALRGGWYHTGDMGHFDAEGNLYLVDRKKDMIISGGENVYGSEVEEALYRHPAVAEAAVFGIPDARWGEIVAAVVVTRAAVCAEELVAHCRTLIAGYKIPRHIELRADPLPKTGAGKVLKRELRAPFWAGRDRSIG